MKGVEVVGFEDDINVSGGKKSRPGLDRILEQLENGEADGLIVSNLDRLSRLGVTDALELIATIQGYGADIAIIEPSIDTSDPVTGEFVLTLFLALNRMERQRAKVRWAEAGENAIKRKIHTAASPFGYMRVNEYDEDGNWIRKRDDREGQLDTDTRRLVPHPTEAPIVKEMFRARAAGESWGSLTRRLNEMGSRSRRGHEVDGEPGDSRSSPAAPTWGSPTTATSSRRTRTRRWSTRSPGRRRRREGASVAVTPAGSYAGSPAAPTAGTRSSTTTARAGDRRGQGATPATSASAGKATTATSVTRRPLSSRSIRPAASTTSRSPASSPPSSRRCSRSWNRRRWTYQAVGDTHGLEELDA